MAEPILDLLMMDTHNSYSFAVGDISVYPTNYNVSSPSLEITPPGFKAMQLAFTERSVNIYNSYNLGLCALESQVYNTPIPDGIYELKYTIFPAYKYYVEKTFLRTDLIQEKFDKAFLSTDIMDVSSDIKESDFKTLREINFNIQGAISAANNCANKLAMALYRKANEQLDNYNNKHCFNC